MQVKALAIPDVLLLKPHHVYDVRGYFVETYNMMTAPAVFVRDSQSLSFNRGTIRGLHFQIPPHSQAKLVRVLRGSIYDVAVDLRVGSPTYGHWVAETLTNAGEQLFIPHGLAHGLCTLEDNTEVAYKIDDYYAPEYEQGLLWDDPTLAIDWPVPRAGALISAKDRSFGRFADFVSTFRY